jgi:RecA-family ATPase
MATSQLPEFGPRYLQLPRQPSLWIVEPLLPMGGSLNIYGKAKAGKSLATLQLASCISDDTKGEFLGFPIHTHGKVLYLQMDTSRSIWMSDVENCIEDVQANFDNVAFVDKEMAPRPFDLRGEGFNYLKAACQVINPLVVVVDTIRKCHDGDENDSGQMKQIMEKIQIAIAPAALIIVSHARKDNPNFEDLMGDNRGSNFIPGEMDTVMRVSKKRFTYEGRAVEERRLDLSRTKRGFWAIDAKDIQQKLFAFLSRPEHKDLSVHALAEKFAAEVGIGVEAARSRIRKVKESS